MRGNVTRKVCGLSYKFRISGLGTFTTCIMCITKSIESYFVKRVLRYNILSKSVKTSGCHNKVVYKRIDYSIDKVYHSIIHHIKVLMSNRIDTPAIEYSDLCLQLLLYEFKELIRSVGQTALS